MVMPLTTLSHDMLELGMTQEEAADVFDRREVAKSFQLAQQQISKFMHTEPPKEYK